MRGKFQKTSNWACASLAVMALTAGCAPSGDTSALKAEIETLKAEVERARAHGAIENVFSKYQYLHTTFRDEEVIGLWVKEGTPGVSAQYTNTGVYNTWDSVMEYHRNRPSPNGKLLTHLVSTPLIEVAEDGQTAKAVFMVNGVESGLADPAVAAGAPAAFFETGEVNGKKVWAHWVQARYHIDFLKQDGEWKIWHFRCVEVSRAPYGQNWIAFAATLENNADAGQFHNDILYFGDDGEIVFYPPHDGPPKNIAYGYRTDAPLEMQPPLPEPYASFDDTFEY